MQKVHFSIINPLSEAEILSIPVFIKTKVGRENMGLYKDLRQLYYISTKNLDLFRAYLYNQNLKSRLLEFLMSRIFSAAIARTFSFGMLPSSFSIIL